MYLRINIKYIKIEVVYNTLKIKTVYRAIRYRQLQRYIQHKHSEFLKFYNGAAYCYLYQYDPIDDYLIRVALIRKNRFIYIEYYDSGTADLLSKKLDLNEKYYINYD